MRKLLLFTFGNWVTGVAFCHASGICHRDLKLDNLILADEKDKSVLKIADFGLSAIVSKTRNGQPASNSNFRRLRSVVGSPYYVAPEVLNEAELGYDGTKADAWSIGVILHVMVAGVMPFGKDLLSCPRFACFRSSFSGLEHENPSYREVDSLNTQSHFANWLYPSQLSDELKRLLSQLLHPNPCSRLSVEECLQDPWVL
uniref:non-specific serine/threonine protein kinase n=1 Tax=Albugo laibachii Nc14 TaxID=890382 RepID=F0WLF8_9STRA|nr:serine/threonine protein kinase putative [Albugo laibachii Nc14]CCA23387.1 serine/threonine protein kinase putative [Albugo laibachii Nc14]|eukprot:CCA23387.1 serine/threonine protein kinase putative [Albugo laibachii Nc14]